MQIGANRRGGKYTARWNMVLPRRIVQNADFLSKFPQGIEDFAHAFVSLQEKRHLADYDPSAKFTKLEVKS